MYCPERYTGRRHTATDVVMALGLLGCVALGASIVVPGFSQPRDDWPAVVLLYRLAAGTDPRATRLYGVVTMAVVVVAAVSDRPTTEMLLLRSVGPVLWLMLPLVGGSRDRLRRDYVDSVQARAAYAERTREEEARLRVVEERMRIARELHDVVAHHMAVANAQAGTARHLAPTRPEQAQRLLDELTATTSSALLELRATVGVLRQGGDADSDSLEPAPGLDRLPELIATCESAGLDATVVTEGEPRALSPGVDLTAYRHLSHQRRDRPRPLAPRRLRSDGHA